MANKTILLASALGLLICTFLQAAQYHTVRNGENLTVIARKYNTSVTNIRDLNNLRSSVIHPGQRLIVKRTDQPSANAPWGYNTLNYTVVRGDSLWSISRRFNVSINSIKNSNNLRTDQLNIGQRLKIMVPRELPDIKDLEPITDFSQKTYYKIQAGDTIESVAKTFNFSPEDLLGFNLLEREDFKPGQILIIPPEGYFSEKDKENPALTREMSLREKLVKNAYGYLGITYKLGGNGQNQIDCSALTMLAHRSIGIDIPRVSSLQYNEGMPVNRDSALPGDLVFFRIRGRVSHVGMYLGEDLFIHASDARGKVTISSLDNSYYKRHYGGIRRFLPNTEDLYTRRIDDAFIK